MEKKLSYYDYAEDDYNYLKDCIDAGIFRNSMVVLAQGACEKYLKHLISVVLKDEDNADILGSTSLRNLVVYIKNHITDFVINDGLVLCADGYYEIAMYPSKDSSMFGKKSILLAFTAVEEVRSTVNEYLETHNASEIISLGTLQLPIKAQMPDIETIDAIEKEVGTIRTTRFAEGLASALKNLLLCENGKCIEKIYAYGSFARGDYNYDSDIDLMLCCSDNLNFEMMREMRSSVNELNLPEVDLKFVTRDAQSFDYLFVDNFKRDGVLIWKRA